MPGFRPGPGGADQTVGGHSAQAFNGRQDVFEPLLAGCAWYVLWLISARRFKVIGGVAVITAAPAVGVHNKPPRARCHIGADTPATVLAAYQCAHSNERCSYPSQSTHPQSAPGISAPASCNWRLRYRNALATQHAAACSRCPPTRNRLPPPRLTNCPRDGRTLAIRPNRIKANRTLLTIE